MLIYPTPRSFTVTLLVTFVLAVRILRCGYFCCWLQLPRYPSLRCQLFTFVVLVQTFYVYSFTFTLQLPYVALPLRFVALFARCCSSYPTHTFTLPLPFVAVDSFTFYALVALQFVYFVVTPPHYPFAVGLPLLLQLPAPFICYVQFLLRYLYPLLQLIDLHVVVLLFTFIYLVALLLLVVYGYLYLLQLRVICCLPPPLQLLVTLLQLPFAFAVTFYVYPLVTFPVPRLPLPFARTRSQLVLPLVDR